jgi:hypothetical protein
MRFGQKTLYSLCVSVVLSACTSHNNSGQETHKFSDEYRIESKISDSLANISSLNLNSISYVVFRDHVMITGTIESSELRTKVLKTIWNIKGVHNVLDYLSIGTKQGSSFSFQQSLTQAKLDTLLIAQGISSHFRYIFFNNTIYVLAYNISSETRETFENNVRKLPKIRKVFLHEIR